MKSKMMSAQCDMARAAAQEFSRSLDAQIPQTPLQEAPGQVGNQEETWHSLLERATRQPLVLALLAAFVAFSLLLLLRPPFVMRFDCDQLRPWRGTTRVSWISVAIVCVVAAGAPLAVWTLYS